LAQSELELCGTSWRKAARRRACSYVLACVCVRAVRRRASSGRSACERRACRSRELRAGCASLRSGGLRVVRPCVDALGSQPKAVDLDYNQKLIAVAPGKSWYDVVGRLTGDSSLAKANIPTTASRSRSFG
jgi:hypothetical protein